MFIFRTLFCFCRCDEVNVTVGQLQRCSYPLKKPQCLQVPISNKNDVRHQNQINPEILKASFLWSRRTFQRVTPLWRIPQRSYVCGKSALDLSNKMFVAVFENSDLLFKTQEILCAPSIKFTAQHWALKFLTKQK